MTTGIPIRQANGPGNLPDALTWNENYDWLEAKAYGNFLINGSFEAGTFSYSSPANQTFATNGWAVVSAGTTVPTWTLASDSSALVAGQYNLKINITVAGSSDYVIGLAQVITLTGTTSSIFANQPTVFGMSIKASTANKVRVRINDGVSNIYSSYHPGDGLYHVLTVQLTIAAASSAVTLQVECSSSNFTGAVFADAGFWYITSTQVTQAAIAALSYDAFRDSSVTPQLGIWTPAFTGFSAAPTGSLFYIRLGRVIVCNFQGSTGTSNATTFTMTVPFSGSVQIGSQASWGTAAVVDNGGTQTQPGRISVRSNSNIADVYKDFAGTGWTASGTKYIVGTTFMYITD